MVNALSATTAEFSRKSNLSAWLDLNPEASAFIQEYTRLTPFAMCESTIETAGNVSWGQSVWFEFARAGDLVGPCFLNVQANPLKPTDSAAQATFVNELGHACIALVSIEVGSVQLDRLTGEFLHIIEEHGTGSGLEQGAAIGSFATTAELKAFSTFSRGINMYVALRFAMFDHLDMYLPIVAMSAHRTYIKVTTQSQDKLVNSQNAAGIPTVYTSVVDTTSDLANGKLRSLSILATLVVLDQNERAMLAGEVIEMLYNEHQFDESDTHLAGSTHQSVYAFSNAAMAFWWRYRADYWTSPADNFGHKDWFMTLCFKPQADQPIASTAWLTEQPIQSVQMLFNGQERMNLDSEVLTQVQPLLHAVKKSKSKSYLMYSFHVNALTDGNIPAGHANLSVIHEVKVKHTFKSGSGTYVNVLNSLDLFGPFSNGVADPQVRAGGAANFFAYTTTTGIITNTQGSVAHYVRSHNVFRALNGAVQKKFASS